MVFVRSAGAVIFRRGPDGRIEYLLLKHRGDYWNFPKGRIEKNEKDKKTVLREVFEETGLTKIKFLSGFCMIDKYFFRLIEERPRMALLKKNIFKKVIFYLARAPYNSRVKISSEHQAFGWFDFDRALKKLKYKGSKKILKEADRFLHDYFSKKSLSNS